MANEIIHSADSADTYYAFVYRISDKFIYDVGDAAFEAIGVWNDARADECDIVMTAVGDVHFADFPTVAAGVYFVTVRKQTGGSPDTDDKTGGQGIMYWDGTAEINTFTLDASINDDIIGDNGDTLESLSDQMDVLSAQKSQVLNVYDK